jgi:hypothetical protein
MNEVPARMQGMRFACHTVHISRLLAIKLRQQDYATSLTGKIQEAHGSLNISKK